NPLRLGTIVPNQQRYNEHKDAYRRQRNHFRSNPRALLELEAWRKCDNNYDYQLLNQGGKAFVPASLVGGGLSGYAPWAKADTFFSEYELHYPSSLILSESDHSYIIGNKASYDGRQYPLALTEKRPEGQGYCHTLVIPKTRIYNVVDPLATENHCFVLKELRDHFFKFWSNEINRDAVLARARKALEERESALVHKGPRHPQYTQSVSNAVFSDFERMKSVFRLLKAEDFVLGFHVFPENSIGHLHMHVFPHDNYFREHSTKDYDYKTVPLQAILDVEEEDEATSAEELVDLTADSSSSDGKVPLNGELPSNAEVPSNTEVPSNAFVAVNKSG
ncbi:MAG: hypothetical protein L6R42_010691, partial [Xanthoria sp. 1 TBL-2021]